MKKCLKQLYDDKIRFDLIYIDPPYKADIAVKATEKNIIFKFIKKDGVIIIETDEKKRELKKLNSNRSRNI